MYSDELESHIKEVLLNTTEVAQLIGVSRTTFWRNVKTGYFPEGLKVSKGKKVWKRSQVIDWIQAKRDEAGF